MPAGDAGRRVITLWNGGLFLFSREVDIIAAFEAHAPDDAAPRCGHAVGKSWNTIWASLRLDAPRPGARCPRTSRSTTPSWSGRENLCGDALFGWVVRSWRLGCGLARAGPDGAMALSPRGQCHRDRLREHRCMRSEDDRAGGGRHRPEGHDHRGHARCGAGGRWQPRSRTSKRRSPR